MARRGIHVHIGYTTEQYPYSDNLNFDILRYCHEFERPRLQFCAKCHNTFKF